MLGTLRAARSAVRRIRDRNSPIILMYHRVAEVSIDPWKLAVNPVNFAEQIETLSRHREIVTLERIADPGGRRRRAAITFDDGYADVLHTALPILDRYQAPATVFLTTGQIGSKRGFWWDELARILLDRQIDRPVTFDLPGSRRRFHASPDDSAVERERTYATAWGIIRLLPAHHRSDVLCGLADQFGVDLSVSAADRCLNAEEVASLGGTRLAVGAHTRTHSSLYALDRAGQQAEICGSRDDCTAMTGRQPDAFAYPFGDGDETAVALVREAGFRQAVTVAHGAVSGRADPLRLPRINVLDWSGREFSRRVP